MSEKLRYWTAMVYLYYKNKPSQPKPKREVMMVLCQAADTDGAEVIARKFAGQHARFGPLLVGMEVPAIYSQTLPMSIRP